MSLSTVVDPVVVTVECAPGERAVVNLRIEGMYKAMLRLTIDTSRAVWDNLRSFYPNQWFVSFPSLLP